MAGCGVSWVNRSSEIEGIPRAKQALSLQQMDHSQWKQKVLARLLLPVDFLIFLLPFISSNFCLHQYFWSGLFLPSPCCSICLGLSPEDHQEPLMLPDVFHYTTVLQNNWLWWQPCETDFTCRICNIATVNHPHDLYERCPYCTYRDAPSKMVRAGGAMTSRFNVCTQLRPLVPTFFLEQVLGLFPWGSSGTRLHSSGMVTNKLT